MPVQVIESKMKTYYKEQKVDSWLRKTVRWSVRQVAKVNRWECHECKSSFSKRDAARIKFRMINLCIPCSEKLGILS
jgi:formylmethanofuran dehydrogenase subunit E